MISLLIDYGGSICFFFINVNIQTGESLKKIILTILVFVSMPPIVKAQNIVHKLIPAGWVEAQKIVGHLDDNGLEDLVLVLKKAESARLGKDEQADAKRMLLLLGQDNPGKYHVILQAAEVLLCSMCGGMMGDPLQSIEIKNKVIIISHYGGSRDRWGMVHRYRFQNGDWYLIGATYSYDDNLKMCGVTNDINLSTHKMQVVANRYDSNGEPIKKVLLDKTMGNQPLPLLKNYLLNKELESGMMMWGIKPYYANPDPACKE